MLVSAIMPTADRAAYAPLALDCFLRQTWTERELVVIDDGAESIAGLFAGVPLVRHTRFTVKSTVGEKRNAGVNFARGEVVVHWDDDDWSAPDRIEEQVGRLLASGKAITGYHRILYWDEARQADAALVASFAAAGLLLDGWAARFTPWGGSRCRRALSP
jgi:glycosyltransferase involved in cell wall biosynthesis